MKMGVQGIIVLVLISVSVITCGKTAPSGLYGLAAQGANEFVLTRYDTITGKNSTVGPGFSSYFQGSGIGTLDPHDEILYTIALRDGCREGPCLDLLGLHLSNGTLATTLTLPCPQGADEYNSNDLGYDPITGLLYWTTFSCQGITTVLYSINISSKAIDYKGIISKNDEVVIGGGFGLDPKRKLGYVTAGIDKQMDVFGFRLDDGKLQFGVADYTVNMVSFNYYQKWDEMVGFGVVLDKKEVLDVCVLKMDDEGNSKIIGLLDNRRFMMGGVAAVDDRTGKIYGVVSDVQDPDRYYLTTYSLLEAKVTSEPQVELLPLCLVWNY